MKSKIIIAKAYISMLFFDILYLPWGKWNDLRAQSNSILKIVKEAYGK